MIKQVYDLTNYQNFCDSLKTDPQYSDPHFIYAPNTLYDAFSHSNQSVYVSYGKDVITGYDLKVKEPYENETIKADLLSQALHHNKPNTMMVLTDADNELEISILETVGFKLMKGQNSIPATIWKF